MFQFLFFIIMYDLFKFILWMPLFKENTKADTLFRKQAISATMPLRTVLSTSPHAKPQQNPNEKG